MIYAADIAGVAFAILGAILVLWRNKRKFDRTNEAGIERFASYADKLGATAGDLAIAALAFIVLTASVIGLAYAHLDTWGWIILGPFYAWVVVGAPVARSK